MTRMNEAWAAITAAIAAGVFGIGGSIAGLYIGRSQTADQADVEHGQWLRGQRQEAYVTLLDAWDGAIRTLQSVVDVWEHANEEIGQGVEYTLDELVTKRVGLAWDQIARPIEGAHLLGPDTVEQAVEQLEPAFEAMTQFLHAQAAPQAPGTEEDWGPWTNLLSQAHQARRGLVAAAKATLGTPPRPAR